MRNQHRLMFLMVWWVNRFYGTHVEGVDLWIRPVDQLLGEVAPFHQQHVHLWRQKLCFQEDSKTKEFSKTKTFCVCCVKALRLT